MIIHESIPNQTITEEDWGVMRGNTTQVSCRVYLPEGGKTCVSVAQLMLADHHLPL